MSAILLRDVSGTTCDSGAISTIKNFFFSRSPTQSSVPVLRGELLIGPGVLENAPNSYMLNTDSKVHLFCDKNDVAPLNGDEFSLLEAIRNPSGRLDAFEKKLEWGVQLRVGVGVCVSTREGSGLESAHAVVRYKGEIGNIPGIQFGIELIVS